MYYLGSLGNREKSEFVLLKVKLMVTRDEEGWRGVKRWNTKQCSNYFWTEYCLLVCLFVCVCALCMFIEPHVWDLSVLA